MFEYFDKEPIAAASIAQVHKARMRSGDDVAVKILRPDIKPVIEEDLTILTELAELLTKHTRIAGPYDLRGMVADFKKALLLELDFVNEAENMDRFRANTSEDAGIFVPEVKWMYTNSRILTMEFVSGIKLSDKSSMESLSNDDKKNAAVIISTSIVNQIIRDGFFHADPHPGNIFIKNGKQIYFLDLGMMGVLNEKRKDDIKRLFMGISFNNSRMIVDSLTAMSNVTYQKNIIKFENDINILMEKYLKANIGSIRIDEFFGSITKIAHKYEIKIVKEFFLVAKCLVILQNILDLLYPELNIYEIAKSISGGIKPRAVNFDEFKVKLLQLLTDYKDLLMELPFAALNFLKKVQNDDYSIGVEIKNEDKFINKADSISNRISFSIILLALSIIIAGVIVGNSLSTGAEIDPFNRTVQTFGFIMAIIIMIGLLISMYRSHKK